MNRHYETIIAVVTMLVAVFIATIEIAVGVKFGYPLIGIPFAVIVLAIFGHAVWEDLRYARS